MDQGEVVSQNCALKSTVEAVEARLRAYEATLQTWSHRAETYPGPWAAFLQKR